MIDRTKDELKEYKVMEKAIMQLEQWIKERKTHQRLEQDEVEEETRKIINEFKEKQKAIRNKILKLKQPYQNILFSVYVFGNTIEKTGFDIGYCNTQTYKLLKKAIEMYREE